MKTEDRLIVELTRAGPADTSLFAGEVDWGYLLRTGRANRVQGLIFDGLDRNGLLGAVPEGLREGMERAYLRDVRQIRFALEAAGRIAARSAAVGIPLVVLRGPALGLGVYPRPFLRPFSDLDLLVSRDDLDRAKGVLGEEGFAPAPGTWPDGYFERNHLHLAYRHPETGLALELHWALDHPYSRSLVDCPSLLTGRREAAGEGVTIPVLAPGDRLLALSLHLFKHCPFLSELLEEENFLHLLLRGRWLLWLIDIHLSSRAAGGEADRASLAEKARRWHLERETAVCLKAAAAVYGESPGRDALPPTGSGRGGALRRALYRRQLEFLERGVRSRPLTRRLFGLEAEAVFRPVRLLDLAGYVFPGRSWLEKRYGTRGWGVIGVSVIQAIRAAGRIAGNLLEYLYYRFRPW